MFIATDPDRPVRLDLGESRPRVGRVLRGRFLLDRGVSAGEEFEARLRCRRDYYRSNADGDSELVNDEPYEQLITVRATVDADQWVVPFEFDVHVTLPPSVPGSESDADYAWHLFLISEFKGSPYAGATGFVLQFAAAPPGEVRAALDANETPEITRAIERINQRYGRTLLPHQRFRLGQRPEELEIATKTIELSDSLSKGCLMVFVAMVAFTFVVLPLVPLVIGVWRHLFGGAP